MHERHASWYTNSRCLTLRMEDPRDSALNDLEYAISWNRSYMNIVGIWPDQSSKKNGLSLKCRALIPVFVMFFFVSVPQSINLLFLWNDLDLVIDNLCLGNICISTALVKQLLLVYNEKALRTLIRCIIEDWMRPKSERERAVMLRSARKAKMMSTVIASVACSTSFSCILAKLVTNALKSAEEDSAESRMLLRGYFPYDLKQSPNFELTFLAQCIADMYAVLTYSSIDGFLTMVVVHLCGQFVNLRADIRNLVSKTKLGKNAAGFRERLVSLVERHERLYKSAMLIENFFNVMMLVQMLASTLVICFQGYIIIMTLTNDGGEKLPIFQLIFLTAYISCVTVNLYAYCYVGDMLYYQSTAVCYAAYETEWYELAPKDACVLIIIMCRARKPITITAGKFFSLSMETFSNIMKTSAGYLSMLLAVKG